MRFTKAVIAGACIAIFSGAASAQQADAIRVGDTALTCPQIVSSASEMSQILGGAPTGGVFASEQAISAATSVAMQGAIMAGAGRVLPGMGLLSNAVGAAARRDRERREAEQLVAKERWYYLNGLYAGRECDRVLAEAAADTTASSATPTPDGN